MPFNLATLLTSPPAPPSSPADGQPLAREVDPFGGWLARLSPEWPWDWRHQRFVRSKLHAVTAGTRDRLILSMPPRHTKSEMVTVRYALYRLWKSGGTARVLIGAHTQRLANKFSRKIRRLAERLPDVTLARDRKAVEEWETDKGGCVRAAGVGAGIAGDGFDLLILDDLVKSREEAQSEAVREKTWDWYTDDVVTRLEPGAAIVIVMTRWHEDDIVGRILASEEAADWEAVTLRAEAEGDDPAGLERGEDGSLWPEKYPADVLARRRKVLGSSYYALYQQRPRPKDGDLIKHGWLVIVPASPVNGRRVRYWDKAGTEGAGAFSCGVLMSRTADGLYYVEDVVRGQWSIGQRNAVIRQTAELDRQRHGHVVTWQEQEPGSGGKESAEITARQLAGYRVKTERVTGDKVVRFMPFADQAEAGNVRVVRAAWNAAYLSELAAFPGGKYKDQADGTSGAFNKLAALSAGFEIDTDERGGSVLDGLPHDAFA